MANETEKKSGSAEATGNAESTTTDPTSDIVVRCTTEDGDVVEVKLEVIRQSCVINQMAQDLISAERPENGVIEIPVQMKTAVFNKVVEWCEHHEGKPEPVVKEDPMTRERVWFTLDDYETSFLAVPIEDLADLMTAGNYLDIKSLYLYSCQTFASHLKGKSPDAIREMLGIENDLTPEEEAEIRQKNVWVNY